MNRLRYAMCLLAATIFGSEVRSAEPVPPSFRTETIDDNVQIGYGVAIGDVDGDGKADVLLADKRQFVWYRNPDWQRFVMAEDVTPLDNVCLAARDLDGDGRVEVAVGAGWNPSDTENSGSVHYLLPPEDRRERWTPIALHHEPTVHRMHWVRVGEQQYRLVVAPLHGRGNRNGEGAGVKLLSYTMPADPRDPWTTDVIDDTMHMTHNLDTCQWIADTQAEELLYIGREGAVLLAYQNNAWTRHPFARIEGGGEIRMGLLSSERKFIATIEPMHGDRLMLYPAAAQGKAAGEELTALSDRILLDDNYNGGHAIATGALFGNGSHQVVAGWRLPNRDQKVGVKLYYAGSDGQWQSMWIDDNGMATEDLRLADLNGDDRLDIIAAGRQTNNLRIYWNEGGR